MIRSFAGLTTEDLFNASLKGTRRGPHSLRINDQFRVCFRWEEESYADDVEITDYR